MCRSVCVFFSLRFRSNRWNEQILHTFLPYRTSMLLSLSHSSAPEAALEFTHRINCRSNGKTINNKLFFFTQLTNLFSTSTAAADDDEALSLHVCDNMQSKCAAFVNSAGVALCMCATLRHVIFSQINRMKKMKNYLALGEESETRNKSVTIRGNIKSSAILLHPEIQSIFIAYSLHLLLSVWVSGCRLNANRFCDRFWSGRYRFELICSHCNRTWCSTSQTDTQHRITSKRSGSSPKKVQIDFDFYLDSLWFAFREIWSHSRPKIIHKLSMVIRFHATEAVLLHE